MATDSASQRRIWIDGRLVPWEQATVHLLSHSLQRGSLIFDYMSVHDTPRGEAVFRLDEHVARFLRSAELVGLPLEQDAAAVRAAILEAVAANPGARSAKVCAYFASVEIDVVPRDTHLTLAVAAYDPMADILGIEVAPPASFPPLRLWIEKERRNRREDILHPEAKVAASYASPMGAKWEARRRGYDEVVFLDDQGCLAEGPTTNLFLVDAEGNLRTPPEQRVLHGITRRSILEIAKHDGRTVLEEPLQPEALLGAREAFLTGTTAGVWPVASVDDHELPAGAPGPVAAELGQRFRDISEGRDSEFAHWLTPAAAGARGGA